MRRLIIIGNCGNGGDVIALVESLKSKGELWEITGYLDDAGPGRGCLRQTPWLGKLSEATRWLPAEFAIAIGSESTYLMREGLFLSTGLDIGHLVTLVHPFAQVSTHARISQGVIVQHGCCVGDNAQIGTAVYIGPLAHVGHDSVVGAWSVIAPGSIICGRVHVEDCVYIGAGSCLRPGIRVGTGALIGMGAVVTKDVPAGAVVVGNPAKILKYVKSDRNARERVYV